MNQTDLLIKENNTKRKQLNKINLAYYEDMLIYIRLSFNKSDLATEEILSELLDHLIIAQEDGKTAYDVFGDNPKAYAKELIGELPRMIPKNALKYFLMAVMFFFGVKEFSKGVIESILYFGFSKGSYEETIYLSTSLINIVVMLPVAFALVYVLITYLRWSLFKNINKFLEFFLSALWGIFSFGVFILFIYIMPDIGPTFVRPIWIPLLTGSVLLFIGQYILRKI